MDFPDMEDLDRCSDGLGNALVCARSTEVLLIEFDDSKEKACEQSC